MVEGGPSKKACNIDTNCKKSQLCAVSIRALTSWLQKSEILFFLQNWKEVGYPEATAPPSAPPSGSLLLYNKKKVPYFRRDNHKWRTKADGITVRETHEKLKIGNLDVLNCYYAHSELPGGIQRRSYWLLDSTDEPYVLVHYLAMESTRLKYPSARSTAQPTTATGIAAARLRRAKNNSRPTNSDSSTHQAGRRRYVPLDYLQSDASNSEESPKKIRRPLNSDSTMNEYSAPLAPHTPAKIQPLRTPETFVDKSVTLNTCNQAQPIQSRPLNPTPNFHGINPPIFPPCHQAGPESLASNPLSCLDDAFSNPNDYIAHTNSDADMYGCPLKRSFSDPCSLSLMLPASSNPIYPASIMDGILTYTAGTLYSPAMNPVDDLPDQQESKLTLQQPQPDQQTFHQHNPDSWQTRRNSGQRGLGFGHCATATAEFTSADGIQSVVECPVNAGLPAAATLCIRTYEPNKHMSDLTGEDYARFVTSIAPSPPAPVRQETATASVPIRRKTSRYDSMHRMTSVVDAYGNPQPSLFTDTPSFSLHQPSLSASFILDDVPFSNNDLDTLASMLAQSSDEFRSLNSRTMGPALARLSSSQIVLSQLSGIDQSQPHSRNTQRQMPIHHPPQQASRYNDPTMNAALDAPFSFPTLEQDTDNLFGIPSLDVQLLNLMPCASVFEPPKGPSAPHPSASADHPSDGSRSNGGRTLDRRMASNALGIDILSNAASTSDSDPTGELPSRNGNSRTHVQGSQKLENCDLFGGEWNRLPFP